MLLDNIFRPVIAAKGLQTPMIVIFVGVMGGALSLGMIGLFIGPVILAVFYEMIALWTAAEAGGDSGVNADNAEPDLPENPAH